MLYFVFTPLFLLLRLFWLVRGFDFRFTYIEPSNGRKGWSWAQMDQGRLQKTPIKPKAEDPRQNPRTKKKHQNAAFGKRRNSEARDRDGLPVVFTTAHGASGTAVRPLLHWLVWFLSCPFVFLRDFFDFCHLKGDVAGHIGDRIPPHSIHHSPSLVLD